MIRAMIRAVFLDLDDTLIDRAAAFRRFADGFTAAHPAVFPADTRAQDIAALVAKDDGGHFARSKFFTWVCEMWPALPMSAVELEQRFRVELVANVAPMAGAIEMVTALRARVAVAILTNGGVAIQRQKLHRSGFADLVAQVFIAEAVGAPKPAPAMFEQALAWANCTAREAVMVGNSPMADIAGAAHLGLRTVWVNADGRAYPADCPPPDRTISSVTDLPAAVADWW